jgi:hypothetical protein
MTNLTNTQVSIITPLLVVNASFTLLHTKYEGWSGKVYGKGRVSGVSAISTKDIVTISRTTEKAILVTRTDGSTSWLPKSKVSANEVGGYTVNKGFCYFITGISWTPKK